MMADFETFKNEQREVLDKVNSKKVDFKEFLVTKT
jgi:hypothetical protein